MLRPDLLEGMRPATGGFATSVWRIEPGQQKFALRVFRAHERHVLEREVAVMRAAAAGGIPVPRVHAIGLYDERPAVLLDWCRGSPIIAQPWLAVAFGRLHRRLHSVRAPVGVRTDWIDWPRAAESSVAERLRALPLRGDRLLHLDFHPLNVLGDGLQLTAVLDWTNAHAGDPRADFARTVTILRLSPPWGDRKEWLGRRLFEVGWRLGYGPPGPDMAPFYRWAAGAMLHDLAGRYSSAELAPIRAWSARWLG
jgi:aminoglycoside phosphotransferase (APT) family kinase protein